MRIAVTSQNFRTITGHAGRARRFMVFVGEPDSEVREVVRFDLPPDMAMHGFDETRGHPLDGTDVLITAGCGEGFARRLARRGIRVVATRETDPQAAVQAFLAGRLIPAPTCDEHDGHEHDEPEHGQHGEAHTCGCHH